MSSMRVLCVLSCLPALAAFAPAALAQAPTTSGAAAPAPVFTPPPPDPRAQVRSYEFAETHEQIPYALYVSSKVREDQKAPLIVALHGLCGTHSSLLRGNALDLAEEGGYIIVGPMGYNPRGWYGTPAMQRPPGAPGPGAPNANVAPGASGQPQAASAPPTPRPRPASCGQGEDPPNLRELSEKDVLNVLDLVKKEFNVDEHRTYLMGHSMGGAGTFHIAEKYPDKWAAIAAIAPAAFAMQPASIATIPKMPVMIVHGDSDTAVPVTLSRSWVEVMKEHGMTYEYLEIPGGDHGNVIPMGMPNIFAFFAAHTK
jgi:poly(3-hydroxybutyrate) depolymerase